jgi:peptide deformylase
MSVLSVLEYPDPRLRTKARPVATVDDAVRRLVEDLLETMYAAPGIGLAATQVDVHERILVLDISTTKDDPRCFINPEIVMQEGSALHEEGCLSVPGINEDVERAEKIRVRALNRDGQPFELEAEGLMAVCIQHEMDHLDGKLFVDYLSELKRLRIRKKALKQRKREPADGRASTPRI